MFSALPPKADNRFDGKAVWWQGGTVARFEARRRSWSWRGELGNSEHRAATRSFERQRRGPTRTKSCRLIIQAIQTLKTITAATIRTPTTKLQPTKRGDGSGIVGFSFVLAMHGNARSPTQFLIVRSCVPVLLLGALVNITATRREAAGGHRFAVFFI
jgi:hypothetical protein